MKKFNKGFTLIELLVVIAIIGILSSVVLASLNTARNKGADAAIKSNINSIRTQAALFYDTNSTYTGLCSDNNVKQMINSATSSLGSTNAGCVVGSGGFAAWSQLKTDSSKYYCVDATGTANSFATDTAHVGAGTCQ